MSKIVVLGSQNANPNDRFLEREEIKSVQCYDGSSFFELEFFKSFGDLGIPSFCWDIKDPLKLYFTSGVELFQIDLYEKECKKLNLSNLKDVHEIDLFDGLIWLSNTYFDELVAYSIAEDREVKRLKLQPKTAVASNIVETTNRAALPIDENRKSKFHTNQVFKSFNGELHALIHHMNGEQLIKKVAQKLLKSQGNGGVINLETGETHKLKLKAPHSVRLVEGNYWIFDSGHSQLNVYSKEWELIKEMRMAGWGRGGAFSEKENLYYAGVSAKRRRYLASNEEAKQENMIQMFSSGYALLDELLVPNVEQINNIYLMSEVQLKALENL